MLPWDFDRLTPADWTECRRGLRDRAEDAWELAAWIVLQCAHLVARDIQSPVGMVTLIPTIYARRERRRMRAEAERERVNAERQRAGLPPLGDDEEEED